MKKGLLKSAHYIVISIFLILISSLFFLSKIDLRVHDLFLATRPSLSHNPEILLVDIDKASVNSIGSFPFSRQLYGEMFLLLKEAKTKTVLCNLDLSYESRNSKDDEFLSQALYISNNVYLSADFLAELEDEEESYPYTGCKNPVPFVKVSLEAPVKTFSGIIPPLKKFENNSLGIGSTNYYYDRDGKIRRIPLVSKYGNKYFSNLAFAGILDYLGNPDFKVQKNKIIIYDAGLNGRTKNIKIPLTKDGSVILKYPKKNQSDFNRLSAKYLIDIIDLERELIEEVNFLKTFDFFEGVPDSSNPLIQLSEYEKLKQSMFYEKDNQEFYFDQYLSSKKQFYDSVERYISGNYVDIIFELSSVSEEDKNNISNKLDKFAQKYNLVMDSKKQLEEKLRNTLCNIESSADKNSIVYNDLILENMIYSQDFTNNCPWYFCFILTCIICLIFAILESFNSKGFINLISEFFSFLFLLLFIEYVFFLITGIFIGIIVPLVALFFCFAVFILLKIIERVKAVIESSSNHDQNEPVTGNETAFVTFMHCELKDFDRIKTDVNDSNKILNIVNTYACEVSKLIWANKGCVEIINEASVLAVFGAPYKYENHGHSACTAALKIKELDLILSEKFSKECGADVVIFTEIGINTKEMPLHQADKESNYLEELNKTYNTRGIIISEETRNQVGGSFIYRRMNKVKIVGFPGPMRVYELLADNSLSKLIPYTNKWEEAITLFEQKQYNEALSVFNELGKKSKNDGVLDYYIQRCTEFIENPKDVNWDGVLYITSK